MLQDEGVSAQLTRDATLNTTVKLRVIGRQQQLLRIDFENLPAADALEAKLADFEKRLAVADAVILSDYAKGALTHVDRMIRAARDAGKIVLVDPKGDDYERYRHATLLTPNRSEFREVAGAWKSEADFIARAAAVARKSGCIRIVDYPQRGGDDADTRERRPACPHRRQRGL